MQSHRFHDFDAFADSVQGVECQMMLQNPKTQSWSVDNVTAGEIYIQFGRLGSGNIVEGQSLADKHLLYLPLSRGCKYTANGETVGLDSFAILEPGCEFCISTKSEHDWCAVHLPNHLLAGEGEPRGPSAGSELGKCRITTENRQLAGEVRKSIKNVMTAADRCPQFESKKAASIASASLRKVAAAVIGQPLAIDTRASGRPKISRREIIGRSMELVERLKDQPVLLGQLAAAAEVSERTLETAFKEYFGISPSRYLQLRQLHQISRALKAADPDTTSVTDVLVRYGVWQFGRLAARYRQLFGELPSETLRTKRR